MTKTEIRLKCLELAVYMAVAKLAKGTIVEPVDLADDLLEWALLDWQPEYLADIQNETVPYRFVVT